MFLHTKEHQTHRILKWIHSCGPIALFSESAVFFLTSACVLQSSCFIKNQTILFLSSWLSIVCVYHSHNYPVFVFLFSYHYWLAHECNIQVIFFVGNKNAKCSFLCRVQYDSFLHRRRSIEKVLLTLQSPSVGKYRQVSTCATERRRTMRDERKVAIRFCVCWRGEGGWSQFLRRGHECGFLNALSSFYNYNKRTSTQCTPFYCTTQTDNEIVARIVVATRETLKGWPWSASLPEERGRVGKEQWSVLWGCKGHTEPPPGRVCSAPSYYFHINNEKYSSRIHLQVGRGGLASPLGQDLMVRSDASLHIRSSIYSTIMDSLL